MKFIKTAVVVMFALIVLVPVAAFRFEEGAVSEIDNRVLAGNPFSDEAEGDLTDSIQNYVNDRIGFRDDMISAYTILHDRLFGIMVHPSYTYGRDGYVFGAGVTVNNPYTEYHEAFADMVKKIQDYCDDRDIPFLFVFDPAKPAVLTDYIAEGTNYDRSWVESFFDALDARGVRYLDNTVTLREKTDEGEAVFNRKYDANHWNDLGAFYGTNAILEALSADLPAIHVNTPDDLTVSSKVETSLPVSKFPINEAVPVITVKGSANSDMTKSYAGLERHPSYTAFGYYTNEERLAEGAPRALVFQGSYMNSYGVKYLANAFGEYIYVHDYQNIMDLAYYYNIFKPDCVIFEVAEYTLTETYFSYDKMCAMGLNPTFEDALGDNADPEIRALGADSITVESDGTLTKLRFACEDTTGYAWLLLDGEYDMRKTKDGYEVTVLSSVYERYRDGVRIAIIRDGSTVIYTAG